MTRRTSHPLRGHLLLVLHALLILTLPLAACGGGTAPVVEQPLVDPASFKAVISNPYLPLDPGVIRRYEGTHHGEHRLEEETTLLEQRTILGVRCTAIQQRVLVGGVVYETTTEWYAEDTAGNVWKFGEEAHELEGDVYVLSDDSWIAGEGLGVPWLALPADPQVGMRLYGYRPDGVDQFTITSIHARADVPGGLFEPCLELEENPDDPEDKDIILYARGVGRVSEDNIAGRLVLVSY